MYHFQWFLSSKLIERHVQSHKQHFPFLEVNQNCQNINLLKHQLTFFLIKEIKPCKCINSPQELLRNLEIWRSQAKKQNQKKTNSNNNNNKTGEKSLQGLFPPQPWSSHFISEEEIMIKNGRSYVSNKGKHYSSRLEFLTINSVWVRKNGKLKN